MKPAESLQDRIKRLNDRVFPFADHRPASEWFGICKTCGVDRNRPCSFAACPKKERA